MNYRVIVWMLAMGLTCLLTLLLTALLAVPAGIIAVAADRRRRQNKAPEQVPANTATQNAYGTHVFTQHIATKHNAHAHNVCRSPARV